jgi:hypothetical protein
MRNMQPFLDHIVISYIQYISKLSYAARFQMIVWPETAYYGHTSKVAILVLLYYVVTTVLLLLIAFSYINYILKIRSSGQKLHIMDTHLDS